MDHYHAIYNYASKEMSGVAYGMTHINRVMKNALELSDS